MRRGDVLGELQGALHIIVCVNSSCQSPAGYLSFAAESSAHTNPSALDGRARQSEAPERRDEWPGSLVKWVGTLGATALLLRTLRRR